MLSYGGSISGSVSGYCSVFFADGLDGADNSRQICQNICNNIFYQRTIYQFSRVYFVQYIFFYHSLFVLSYICIQYNWDRVYITFIIALINFLNKRKFSSDPDFIPGIKCDTQIWHQDGTAAAPKLNNQFNVFIE